MTFSRIALVAAAAFGIANAVATPSFADSYSSTEIRRDCGWVPTINGEIWMGTCPSGSSGTGNSDTYSPPVRATAR